MKKRDHGYGPAKNKCPAECPVCFQPLTEFSNAHTVQFINNWTAAKCACGPFGFQSYHNSDGRLISGLEFIIAMNRHTGDSMPINQFDFHFNSHLKRMWNDVLTKGFPSKWATIKPLSKMELDFIETRKFTRDAILRGMHGRRS